MPTIAGTAKEKRLFSELFNDGDVKSKKQRVRFDDVVEVLTEEDSDDDEDVGDELDRQDSEDEDVDFILSIGEDGDIDYTIITSTTSSSCHSRDHPTSQEDNNKQSSPKQHYLHDKIARPASPFAGSDRQLCEELYMSFSSFHEGMTSTSGSDFNCFTSPSRSSACWSSSLGNNLKILIPNSTKGNSHEDDNIGGRKVSFDSKVGARSPPSPPYGDDESVMLTPLITPPSSPRRVVCNISSENGKVTEEEAVICEWPCNLTVDNAITSALELSLP